MDFAVRTVSFLSGRPEAPPAPHYTAKRELIKGTFAVLLFLAAGCAAPQPFWRFEWTVTTQKRGPDGSWKPEGRAREQIVLGPGYLRIVSRSKGSPPLVRIYDEHSRSYWEIRPGGGNLWPLEEVLERIETAFVKKRWEARAVLAGVSPLLRTSGWRLFSGDPKEVVVTGAGPVLFGVPTQRLRVGALPGMPWEAIVARRPLLEGVSWELVFLTLGVPRDNARVLARSLGGFPLDITMTSADRSRRVRCLVVRAPEPASAESPEDVVPHDLWESMQAREEKLKHGGTLLRILDGEKAPPGVTLLGACVRFARMLKRSTVQSAIKRFEALKDPEARRCLMVAAARVAPDRAVSRLLFLVKHADLAVAWDAAWALSKVLPAPRAAQLVGTVLRRVRRGEDKYTDANPRLSRRLYMWGTDLLRLLTGRDWGFWPNVEEEAAVERWLNYLSQLKEESGQNVPSFPAAPANDLPAASGFHAVPESPAFPLP